MLYYFSTDYKRWPTWHVWNVGRPWHRRNRIEHEDESTLHLEQCTTAKTPEGSAGFETRYLHNKKCSM